MYGPSSIHPSIRASMHIIYIYIYTHTPAHAHTYAYHTYGYASTFAYTGSDAHTDLHTHTHPHTYAPAQTIKHTRAHVHAHTRAFTCTCACAFTYTYMYRFVLAFLRTLIRTFIPTYFHSHKRFWILGHRCRSPESEALALAQGCPDIGCRQGSGIRAWGLHVSGLRSLRVWRGMMDLSTPQVRELAHKCVFLAESRSTD